MIYLSDVREWIRTLIQADHFYIGRLDRKPEKAIGVYQRKGVAPPVAAVGRDSSYEVKPVSVLIHWNKNADQTEKAALELYEAIKTAETFTLGDTRVLFIKLPYSEPIDVGSDDNGIFERVIDFDIFYEKGR